MPQPCKRWCWQRSPAALSNSGSMPTKSFGSTSPRSVMALIASVISTRLCVPAFCGSSRQHKVQSPHLRLFFSGVGDDGIVTVAFLEPIYFGHDAPEPLDLPAQDVDREEWRARPARLVGTNHDRPARNRIAPDPPRA